MADAYGLDDFSFLSAPQQDTARTIQRAFDASLAGRNRNLERFNVATGGPMLAQYANDSALRRAQVTAGILNNNQQLQQMIDYSNRSPHGLAENLSAYLPAVGALSRLYPMLFGTNTALSKDGLIPSIGSGLNKVAQWFKGSDGVTYGLDGQGNIVSYGMNDRGIGDLGSLPQNFGMNDRGIGEFGFVPDYNYTTDWTSGYDIPEMDWTSGFDLDWGF